MTPRTLVRQPDGFARGSGVEQLVDSLERDSPASPMPDHREITAGVVRSISKQMACLPKGWLQ